MLTESHAYKEGPAGKRPMAGKNHDDPGCKIYEDAEFVVKTGVVFDLDVKFLETGKDMTIEIGEQNQFFAKEIRIKGFTAEDTCGDVMQRISEVEDRPLSDIRLFCPPHQLAPHVQLGRCYVNWPGFGMIAWPPKFVVKHEVQGFEIVVVVQKMRDTAQYEDYALDPRDNPVCDFGDIHLCFDVTKATTVRELKALITTHNGMPGEILLLFTAWKPSEISPAENIELDDLDAPIGDYGIEARSIIWVHKNCFDKDGRYIFDDEYWEADENGEPKLFHRPKWSTVKGNCHLGYGAKDPSKWGDKP